MNALAKLLFLLVLVSSSLLGALYYFQSDYFLEIIIQLQPPSYSYGLAGLALIGIAAYQFYLLGWEEAKPNEWLIIIQNGEQIKAGVGLIAFRMFYQTAIKFPSHVQKVQFNAMQVCKEMQGLQLQGFAIWAVHRDQPFKFYKQMHGANAEQSIRKICESVVRHQIANTDLETVMTKREILRDNMKQELQNILTGWGVWLETVEITEIKICSTSLFEDMQTPSKQINYLTSEKYKMKTNYEMDVDREQYDAQINKNKEEKETKRLEHFYQQEIRRITQDAVYQKKKFELEKLNVQQTKDYQIEEITKNHLVSKQKLQGKLDITLKEEDADRKQKQKQIKEEQEMSELNMERLRMDASKSLFSKVPIKTINVNAFSQDNSLLSVLPGMGEIENK